MIVTKKKRKKKERQRGRYSEIENTHTPQYFLLQMCSLPKVFDTVCLKVQSDHENKNIELKYSYYLRKKVLGNEIYGLKNSKRKKLIEKK